MSEYDELFNETDDDTPLVRKLRAQLKEQATEIKTAKGELTQLKGAQREQTLSEAIAAKGLNPKVAKFVPSDLEAGSLDEWLAENGDVFGAPTSPAPEPVAPSLGEIKMADLGLDEEASITVPSDLDARLKAATSMAEVKQILGQVG